MEWGDLAKQVISLGAPLLGTALGGPLGGVAGEILAKAVGSVTLTPSAVQTAWPAVDPAKLAEAEARWIELIRAEAETQRVAISETQQTIRAEIVSAVPENDGPDRSIESIVRLPAAEPLGGLTKRIAAASC